jgi:hypothetical protein
LHQQLQPLPLVLALVLPLLALVLVLWSLLALVPSCTTA